MPNSSAAITITSSVIPTCTLPLDWKPAPSCSSIWSIQAGPTPTHTYLWRYNYTAEQEPCIPPGAGFGPASHENKCGWIITGVGCPTGYSSVSGVRLAGYPIDTQTSTCCPINDPPLTYDTTGIGCHGSTVTSWATPTTIQYDGAHTTLTAGDIGYHAMYLNVEQIPMAQTTSAPRIMTPTPTLSHTSQINATISTATYEPLTASVHAGALITGARLDVGLFAFFFIFLGPHML